MELVVVARRFDEERSFEALQQAEAKVAWCLEQHRVRFLRSYLSTDGRSMVCFYEAPDAESVRVTQSVAGLPLESAWSTTVKRFCDENAAPHGRTTVVVERELEQAVDLAFVEQVFSLGRSCLEMHDARPIATHVALDGRRVVCIFDARDAESVRIANRQIGVPVARAWPAKLFVARGI